MVKVLPSFFVIGPPRTGTTWLHEVLKDSVTLPAIKETRFFDFNFHYGMDWYRAQFHAASSGQPIGEIAPTYFVSPASRDRIAKLLPEAKIVCIFRNPVERLLSLYRLKIAYGMIPWNFDQAIVRDPELIESGRYATNLKAWRRAFGEEQVMATLYDDLRDHPQAYLDRLLDFLGIPRFELSSSQRGFVNGSEHMTHPRNYERTRRASIAADWFKARRLGSVVAKFKKSRLCRFVLGGGSPFAELSTETSGQIAEVFRPEVEELEVLMNRDLSAWKHYPPRITTPQMPAAEPAG
ncbi:MAG TPA: sulfotransferase [Terriglobales bacterium]|nr:sulfotransferase [Terriglobales bacterium]